MIRRVSRLGERKDLFETGPDFLERMWEGHLKRQKTVLQVSADARRKLPASMANAKDALRRTEELTALLVESSEKTLAAWRKRDR